MVHVNVHARCVINIFVLLKPVLYVNRKMNAMEKLDNETPHLIVYCLNFIRRDGNSTCKTGLKPVFH